MWQRDLADFRPERFHSVERGVSIRGSRIEIVRKYSFRSTNYDARQSARAASRNAGTGSAALVNQRIQSR